MTESRAVRRAKASKKKSGKTLSKKTNGKSHGMPEIPKLSAAQKKQLTKAKDQVTQIKCRVADLRMEEARTLSKLGQAEGNLQETIKNAMQGAGIDFEESPRGTWGIDFETMELSFEPAPPESPPPPPEAP